MSHIRISHKSIITKLILMNLLILIAVGGVVIVNLLISRQVGDMLNTVIDKDVSRIIKNAELSRNLNKVFADTHLLINTFTKREDLLRNEGNSLVTTLQGSIATVRETDEIHDALKRFKHTLEALLDQCAVIITLSKDIQTTERELDMAFTTLEETVTDLIRTRDIEEKEDELFSMKQVSAAAPDYRTILLQVIVWLASSKQAHLGPATVEEDYESQMLTLLDKLVSELITVSNADEELAPPGKHLIEAALRYKEHIIKLHQAMQEFQTRLNNLDNAQAQVVTVIKRIDKEIIQTTGHIREEVAKNIHASSNVTVFFSVIVIAVLGGVGIYAVRITRPILQLTASAAEMAAGNLDTPIDISGNDEVGRLARSFVHMRDVIQEEMSALAKKNAELIQEITERKRAEEALRQSKNLFQSLIEALPQNIFSKDLEGRFTFVNQRFCRTQGKSAADILGKTDFELHPSELAEKYRADDQKVIETSQLLERVEEHQPLGEKKFYVQVVKTPMYDSNGHIIGILGVFWDITERKQAEKIQASLYSISEAAHTARTLEELFHSIHTIVDELILAKNFYIALYDPATEILSFPYYSDEYYKMPDIPPSRKLRKGLTEYVLRTNTPLLASPEVFEELIQQGEVESIGTPSTYWLGVPLKTHNKTIGVLAVQHYTEGFTFGEEEKNILMFVSSQIAMAIERVRAEEQLKNQNILLEKAVQEKQREMEAMFERLLRQEKLATIGQMAGSIAHELRNPLGAVKQAAFFLKRLYQKHQLENSNPNVQEHLDLIEAEIDTSEQVISNLLKMTRMKTLQREQTDLRPLIEDAAKHCQFPEQIQLILDLTPEPFLIWVDPGQLRQVFINLLTNAIQAIKGDGNITIRAKQLTKDRCTVIEIKDEGIGIEPDILSKIFEPLYTTKATGTGLGLSICKQIIENHHGNISIRSEKGQGTTVMVVLPDQE